MKGTDIKFVCRHCSQHLSCDEEMTGEVVTCPHCSSSIIVPNATISDESKCSSCAPQRKSYTRWIAFMVGCTVLMSILFALIFMGQKYLDANNPEKRASELYVNASQDVLHIRLEATSFSEALSAFDSVDSKINRLFNLAPNSSIALGLASGALLIGDYDLQSFRSLRPRIKFLASLERDWGYICIAAIECYRTDYQRENMSLGYHIARIESLSLKEIQEAPYISGSNADSLLANYCMRSSMGGYDFVASVLTNIGPYVQSFESLEMGGGHCPHYLICNYLMEADMSILAEVASRYAILCRHPGSQPAIISRFIHYYEAIGNTTLAEAWQEAFDTVSGATEVGIERIFDTSYSYREDIHNRLKYKGLRDRIRLSNADNVLTFARTFDRALKSTEFIEYALDQHKPELAYDLWKLRNTPDPVCDISNTNPSVEAAIIRLDSIESITRIMASVGENHVLFNNMNAILQKLLSDDDNEHMQFRSLYRSIQNLYRLRESPGYVHYLNSMLKHMQLLHDDKLANKNDVLDWHGALGQNAGDLMYNLHIQGYQLRIAHAAHILRNTDMLEIYNMPSVMRRIRNLDVNQLRIHGLGLNILLEVAGILSGEEMAGLEDWLGFIESVFGPGFQNADVALHYARLGDLERAVFHSRDLDDGTAIRTIPKLYIQSKNLNKQRDLAAFLPHYVNDSVVSFFENGPLRSHQFFRHLSSDIRNSKR